MEPLPPARPGTARRTPATDVLEAAAANVVGHSRHTWLSRTGAERYLPDLVAKALRQATGAGMVLAPSTSPRDRWTASPPRCTPGRSPSST